MGDFPAHDIEMLDATDNEWVLERLPLSKEQRAVLTKTLARENAKRKGHPTVEPGDAVETSE